MKALEDLIRDIPDFPRKGIIYKDITPLLKDPAAIGKVIDFFLKNLKGESIDKVIGIEARRFFFEPILAEKLGAGFVSVRKSGKLPFKTRKVVYDLGSDSLEIHEDALEQQDRVLIHDDVLATGGTALAACELVEKLGGKIIQFNFLIELDFLRGREKLRAYPVMALLKY